MSEIQQQVADGAQPRARVGDVIAHGETIPANVVRLADEAGDDWFRIATDPARFAAQPTCKRGFLAGEFNSTWWPMTVVGVDPEPQPAETFEPDEPVHYYVSELRPGATFCGIGLEDGDLSTTDEAGKATCETCRAQADEDAVSPQPARVACSTSAAHDPHTWVYAPCTDARTVYACDGFLRLKGTATGDNQLDPEPHDPAQCPWGNCPVHTVSPDSDSVFIHVEPGSVTVTQTTGRTLMVAANGVWAEAPDRERITVDFTPAESGPLVLTLPEVPAEAVALIGGKSGWRWLPYSGDGWHNNQDPPNWSECAFAEVLAHEGSVTPEFAPPREPRTWEQLAPAPGDLKAVEVKGYGIFRRHPNTDGWVNDEGALHFWREVLDLGEVREVLT